MPELDPIALRSAMIKALQAQGTYEGLLTAIMLMDCQPKIDKNLPAPAGIRVQGTRIELLLNPDIIYGEFMKDLGPHERQEVLAYLGAHEVLHVMLNHTARERQIMHYPKLIRCLAADMAIRIVLPAPHTIRKYLASEALASFAEARGYDPNTGSMEYWAHVLDKLLPKCPVVVVAFDPEADEAGDGGGDADGSSGSGDSEHDEQGKDRSRRGTKGSADGRGTKAYTWQMSGEEEDSGGNQASARAWVERAIQQAETLAKSRGLTPGAFKEILERFRKAQPPDLKLLATAIGQVPSVPTFTRINKRAPRVWRGHRPEPHVEAVIAWDTSGSMSTGELEAVAGAILQLLAKVRQGALVQCDAELTAELRITPSTPRSKIVEFLKEQQGRGGTAYEPILEYWEKYRRRAGVARVPLIIFTDGECPQPEEGIGPDVYWILTSPECREHFRGHVYVLDIGR